MQVRRCSLRASILSSAAVLVHAEPVQPRTCSSRSQSAGVALRGRPQDSRLPLTRHFGAGGAFAACFRWI
jgi:hypothetical protein